MGNLVPILKNRNLDYNLYRFTNDYRVKALKSEEEILTYLSWWKFKVNNRPKRRYGLCDYSRRMVEVSGFHWKHGTTEEINQTILHELGHALANFVFDTHGHSKLWKLTMRILEAKPNRCSNFSSTRKALEAMPYKSRQGITYVCADCDYEVLAGRKWTRAKYHIHCKHKHHNGQMILKAHAGLIRKVA